MNTIRVKVLDGWPVVLPFDYGIPPAGNPGECFYCHAKVGEPHGKKCVTVCKVVRYNVLMDGLRVGTYVRDEPHHKTPDQCEFHKNESSWCADNAVDTIVWTAPERLKDLEARCPDGKCACGVLEFKFLEVQDDGPIIEICTDNH